MKNKKVKLSVLFLLSIGFHQGYAQQSITSSGGDASGSGGSAAYSVGQIVYTTHTSASGSVAQGVQQAYDITITTGLDETGVSLNLSAYPNPTTNYLMLQVDDLTESVSKLNKQSMSYQLYDINAKLLESNVIVANSTTIKMEQYATATYFLKIVQSNNIVKTFKIIKN